MALFRIENGELISPPRFFEEAWVRATEATITLKGGYFIKDFEPTLDFIASFPIHKLYSQRNTYIFYFDGYIYIIHNK